MASWRHKSVHVVVSQSPTKIAAFLVLCALIGWLAYGDANPWRNLKHLEEVTAKIDGADISRLRTDIEAAVHAAQASTKVNLNRPWQRDALNIYVLTGGSPKMSGWSAGGASYEPRYDVILIDKYTAWPYVTEPSFSGIRTASSQDRSTSDKLWLQFVVLHELGHRTLHRNVSPAAVIDQQAKRRFEDEADAFAFKRLASLLDQSASQNMERPGLFSQSRIAKLPEPDRSAAVIASLIQEFSVSLLFSNAAVSTYYSDSAHKAFSERFKPRLLDLLLTTTTKEGRIFVLLALAAVERVEEAGQNVVAEIVSDVPLGEASFNDSGLEITLLADATSLRKPTIELARSSFVNNASEPVRIRLAESGAMSIRAADTARERGKKLVAGPVRSPQEWPPELQTKRPGDEVLIGLLKKEYDLSTKQCRTYSRVREYPFLDVVFSCGDTFFAGRFDVDGHKLIDLMPLLTPNQRSNIIAADDTFFIADTRIDGERRIFLIEDTLSDERHRGAHQLRVWRAYQGLPRLTGTFDLITDWIPAGSSISNWFSISHPPVLLCELSGEETTVCTELLDSIFQTNLRTGRSGVLFYPAGVRRARDRQGDYAFFAPGGFRLFIVRPGFHL